MKKFIFCSFFALFFTLSSFSQWTPLNTGAVNDIMLRDGKIFITKEKEGVSYSNDGQNWILANTNLPSTFGFYFTTKLFQFGDSVYLGTQDNIYSSIDGINWKPLVNYPYNQECMCTPKLVSLNIYNSNMVAGWEGGGLTYSSTIGGSHTWATGDFGTLGGTSNIIQNDNILYTCTDGGMFKSSDFGKNWTKLTSSKKGNLTFHKNKFFIANFTDGAYYSSDEGTNWTMCKLPDGWDNKLVRSVFALNNLLFISTGTGMHCFSDDAGLSFKDITSTGIFLSAVALDAIIFKDKLYLATNWDIYTRNISEITNSASVNNNITNQEYMIYPNPTKDKIFIAGLKTNSEVMIYDFMGKLILNSIIENNQLDLSNIPNGIYFIKINYLGANITDKIIKY